MKLHSNLLAERNPKKLEKYYSKSLLNYFKNSFKSECNFRCKIGLGASWKGNYFEYLINLSRVKDKHLYIGSSLEELPDQNKILLILARIGCLENAEEKIEFVYEDGWKISKIEISPRAKRTSDITVSSPAEYTCDVNLNEKPIKIQ